MLVLITLITLTRHSHDTTQLSARLEPTPGIFSAWRTSGCGSWSPGSAGCGPTSPRRATQSSWPRKTGNYMISIITCHLLLINQEGQETLPRVPGLQPQPRHPLRHALLPHGGETGPPSSAESGQNVVSKFSRWKSRTILKIWMRLIPPVP